MSVKRWVITDPSDPSPTTNHYLFPRNPVAMTSVYKDAAISSQTTTHGNLLFWQGTDAAKSWSFNGPILDNQHLADLHLWVLTKRRRLLLVDHFGRTLTLIFTTLDVVPKRRTNVYYSHDYTATALLIKVSAPTVPNAGPA